MLLNLGHLKGRSALGLCLALEGGPGRPQQQAATIISTDSAWEGTLGGRKGGGIGT